MLAAFCAAVAWQAVFVGIMMVVIMAIARVAMGVMMAPRAVAGVLRVRMIRVVIRTTGLVCPVSRLGQRIVLVEAFVVPMTMAAAVRANVRLEGCLDLVRLHPAQLLQHIDQNRIIFQLQIAVANLEQDMAVAQVVGCARQLQW